jgi:hypothetical protein
MNDSMLRMPRRLATFCAGAVLAAVAAEPAYADEMRAYSAVSETDTATGIVATRNVLVLRTDAGGATTLSVVTGNEPSAPVSVAFASDGEIVGQPVDPSETCYNMAAVVQHAAQAQKAVPPMLYFALADHAIPIRMNLRSNRADDGSLSVGATGRTDLTIQNDEGVVSSDVEVTAAVESTNGDIRRATFVEVTSVGSPGQPLSRTSCTLTTIPVAVSS